MFSLSNDKMNKMTEDNPLLAMMQSAFANDNDSVKKTTNAWLKAMPGGDAASDSNLASNPMAAMAASSAVGLGMYTQMVGTMLGAMTGAMEAAEKMKDATERSEAPFGMFFNPLTFEWSDVNSEDPVANKPKKARKPSAKKVETTSAEASSTEAKSQPKPFQAVTEPVTAPTKLVKEAAAPKAKAPSLEKATEPVAKTPVATTVETAIVAEIMPEDFKKPLKMEKPETPDDLKLISGVGPKLEQVLNGMGIWKFAQIADWSAEEIAYVDDYLQFKGRIGRDEWLNQAAELGKVE